MFKKLIQKALRKIILQATIEVCREDYMTAVLKGLWHEKKCRLIWKAMCDSGEMMFKDMANECRDAADWPKKYPDEV